MAGVDWVLCGQEAGEKWNEVCDRWWTCWGLIRSWTTSRKSGAGSLVASVFLKFARIAVVTGVTSSKLLRICLYLPKFSLRAPVKR